VGVSRTRLRFLLAGVWLLAAGISLAQTTATTTFSTPVQSSPANSVTNPFNGSVPAKAVPGVLPISLQDAVQRGLRQNLGLLLSRADTRAARGERWQQLSALLPHLSIDPFISAEKLNAAQVGLGGVTLIPIPTSIGPFSFFDARASLAQTLFDWRSINNARAAGESVKSANYSLRDARDLVVLAVGFVYLQAIADEARIETDEAQVKTAQALYDQAVDRVKAGTAADIDALRSKVELQTRQQQLIQAKNDFAIQKLTVARAIGLAPGQEFELTDKSPYQAFEGMTVDDALKRAYASRSDYRAAMSTLRAAELSRQAAIGGYYPSLTFSGDYGVGGAHPSNATSVFDVRGTLSIPIFTGGSVHGDVQLSDARLEQSRERLEDLRAQIDSDVRTALLNLQSAAEQVTVARSNIDLADQTLSQSRDRYAAGVTDTVEVVQSQQSVASAHEQYISSLYNFNFAKISLIRALGIAEQGLNEFFRGR